MLTVRNLHPLRLTQRVTSAKVVGLTYLDGSGKCNICPTDVDSVFVSGVLYEIQNPIEKHLLDEIEGGQFGWESIEIEIRSQYSTLRAFTYMALDSRLENRALPYHWYRDIVLLGAKYHDLPDEFIRQIAETESQSDNDSLRNEMNEGLVTRLRANI